MPRNLTFRCSKETAKRIETALAVRGSGLFPMIPRDGETSEESALLDAIVSQWMRDLKRINPLDAPVPGEPRAFATEFGGGFYRPLQSGHLPSWPGALAIKPEDVEPIDPESLAAPRHQAAYPPPDEEKPSRRKAKTDD